MVGHTGPESVIIPPRIAENEINHLGNEVMKLSWVRRLMRVLGKGAGARGVGRSARIRPLLAHIMEDLS